MVNSHWSLWSSRRRTTSSPEVPVIALSTRAMSLSLLVLLSLLTVGHSQSTWALVGVSGTLQDGFELRDRLDSQPEGGANGQKAIFVGKALVRGYKAYVDIKPQGWREYEAEPNPPRVPNAVVIPTGCFGDANIYWLYLVAPHKVLSILSGEPRFLAITPDTGLIDLQAAETSDKVRQLALSQIQKLGYKDETAFAVPLVTGVWFDTDSFVESPIVYTQDNGTRITSYDESLALWASVDRDSLVTEDPRLADQRFQAWEKVFQKVRETERHPSKTPFPTMCQDEVRFGTAASQLRLNYPLSDTDIGFVSLHDEL